MEDERNINTALLAVYFAIAKGFSNNGHDASFARTHTMKHGSGSKQYRKSSTRINRKSSTHVTVTIAAAFTTGGLD